MKKLALVALLALATTPAFASRPEGSWECPLNYAPVRCSDGLVYGNSCEAQHYGATGCSPLPFWEW
jgi:hypothetical protein